MSDRNPADNHDPVTLEIDREFERELSEMFRRTVPPIPVFNFEPTARVIEHRSLLRRTPILVRVAVSLAAVVMLVTFAVIWQPSEAGANVSFAEVQERVNKTRTLTFRTKAISGEKEREEDESEFGKTSILAPNLVRKEGSSGSYWVIDHDRKRALSVDFTDKQATLFEGRNLSADWKMRNVYDYFREIQSQAVSDLPARILDGEKCPGFLIKYESKDELRGTVSHHELSVWVDPGSKLPVRMEDRFRFNDEPDLASLLFIRDQFVFDAPLDRELFSFDPPPGYELETLGVPKLNPPHSNEEIQKPVITPNVGIGPVTFGMKADEVKQLLGEPDKELTISEGKVNLEYYSRGYWLQVLEPVGVMIITATSPDLSPVRIREFSGKTDKEIGFGASEEEVRKIYGEPSRIRVEHELLGPTTLYYDDLNGWFSFWNGKLRFMTFNMPRETIQKILEQQRPRK